MLSQRNRFLIFFLAILLLNTSFLSIFGDGIDLNTNRNLSTHATGESRQAAYTLNIPFHAGSLFSDRVEPVIICHDRSFRKISSGSFLNLDDMIIKYIVQHNSDVDRKLQLRTSFEFNCILQI